MIERLIWVVPLLVAALGIWRPRAGLVALVAALPLFGASEGGPYLAALEVTALAAIATAWRGGRPEASPLLPAAVGFVVVSLLSLVPPLYQPPSWRPGLLLALFRALPGAQPWSAFYTWRATADLVIGLLLFLAVRRAFAGRSVRSLGLALLAGLSVTLALGIGDYLGLLGLDAFRPALYIGRPSDHRLRSVFFASTRLGEYLVIASPFALAALAGAGRWARRLLLPVAGLVLSGVALTLQRGAWAAAAIQFAFLAAVLAWRHRHDRRLLARAALATATMVLLTGSIIVLSGLPLDTLSQRVRQFSSGLAMRVPVWAAAVEMARERPLLGQGLGTYAPAYDRLQELGLAEAIPFRASGHHLYLQVTAERGVLGLLALGLVGAAAVLCLRQRRAGQGALALGLAASLLGAAVYGLIQNLFQLRIIGWLIWILLGCIALIGSPRESAKVKRAAWALVVTALLVLPFRLSSEGRPEYAGNREFGFHEMESSAGGRFQWTEGFAARRLRRYGDTLVLNLANGHPLGARRPVAVTIQIDGRVGAQRTIKGGWEELRIKLRPADDEWVVLTLRAEPTFRPFSDYRRYPALPRGYDHRLLGVAVREPRWE